MESANLVKNSQFFRKMSSSSSLDPHHPAWKTLLSGAIAGVASRIVIAPLDVVKIRLQLQQDPRSLSSLIGHTPNNKSITNLKDISINDSLKELKNPKLVKPSLFKYTGILQTILTIIKEEGYASLWKGNIPALGLYATYSALQFTSYNKVREISSKFIKNEHICNATSGGLSGCIATVISYPFDLMRTRLASQHILHPTLKDLSTNIYRVDGFLGFYHGIWTSILSIGPQMAAVFWSYEAISKSSNYVNKKYFDSTLGSKSISLISGGAAGIFGKLALMPLDVLRKRLQVVGTNNYTSGIYSLSSSKLFLQTIKNEGILSLYKGSLPSILKAGPASAVTFFTYDLCIRFF